MESASLRSTAIDEEFYNAIGNTRAGGTDLGTYGHDYDSNSDSDNNKDDGDTHAQSPSVKNENASTHQLFLPFTSTPSTRTDHKGGKGDNDAPFEFVPRRWIHDRVDGTVLCGNDKREVCVCPRPPYPLCLPSLLQKVCPWCVEDNPVCLASSNGASKAERSSTAGAGTLCTRELKYALLLNDCGFLATVLAATALTRTIADLLARVSFALTELDPNWDYLPWGYFWDCSPWPFTTPTRTLRNQAVPPARRLWRERLCKLLDHRGNASGAGGLHADVCAGHSPPDINCPKVLAGLWSLLCVCLALLYHGAVVYSGDGSVSQDSAMGPKGEGTVAAVTYDWTLGARQLLFLIELALKMVVLVIHCCVATPIIARSKSAQWDYKEACWIRSHVTATNDGYQAKPNQTSTLRLALKTRNEKAPSRIVRNGTKREQLSADG
eukprot:jgi/Psemu1/2966/gm1.2966_g